MFEVVIRVDASEQIGLGHIMRCLTLADMLKQRGASTTFISRPLPQAIYVQIKKHGHKIRILRDKFILLEDADAVIQILHSFEAVIDLLIIDQYELDYVWERCIRPYVKHIAVIDDLANRRHDCDFLLDQNFVENMEGRYNKLVPPECQLFLGPKNALLRQEFYTNIEKVQPRNKVDSALVSFGGSDPTGETMKIVRAIRKGILPKLHYSIVIGGANARAKEIEDQCRQLKNISVHLNAQNMSELILESDICIGSPGISTWERCILGLPSIHIIVADNQLETAFALEKAGLAWNMGWHNDVNLDELGRLITSLQQHPEHVEKMSRRIIDLMESAVICKVNPMIDAIFEGGTS
ncbi:UDP-2,4-diacetamido-2,4,6-trideoxy-beta-L-altropyranose hydrolase [Paenibacillus dendritiformis]|uniref:Pseudaminic acid biosynthesis-associated protein PseG n=1 Tax=Paenibacillus dendritiformis C454 TaxID=1131935 RepID=H3S9T2_9BACL|nr:UDP-2,4-diacetamido-2,4,6-trideoxy-beta-L-altropyranose hydrolase [Paenibacillus dendritiformis]EHQ64200.1 pseudaminic acid biosynthesis-associated protein PseG [Paenibacillus dendritiformis C454]CAH8767389.1 UDP-2,4-diacetamido-2,4,6-trideoxy-beta-L-altropyranose hydrolase [Paenibacillus dendritiformis]